MFAPPIKAPEVKMASQAPPAHRFKPLQSPAACQPQAVDPKREASPEGARSASWDFSKIPLFAPNRPSGPEAPRPFIQPKLMIGRVNDPLEHEADRVAEEVMRMPASDVSAAAAPAKISSNLPAKPPGEYRPPEAARVTGEASSAAWDFSKVPVFSPERINQSRVQSPTAAPPRGLAMGPVDDPLEHEADAIADKVMRMPAGEADGKRSSSTVSEKSGPADVYRKPLASNSVSSSQSPAHVQNAIGSGGQKLDRSTRSFFEPRLGYNLNSVRIYTGSRAAESAKAIDAKAYSLGNNIVFGTGQYRPETDIGKQLLAHELAHVVQSGSSSNIRRDTIYRQPDDGSAQLTAIEYEIQMLGAMPVKLPPAIVRLTELYEQRNKLLARRASYSMPARTKPTKSPARAAAEQVFEATYGKENLPSFNESVDRAEEVTEANRIYMTTGQIPQTRSPFLPIEIKEGRLMSRAERYDAMVRKLGMGKTIAQIDDITYDNRDPEYLTQREFKEEYWARYQAERDYCYDEYFWPKYERQCIRRVQEKYGGESFIAWREGRERELAYRIQVAKAQIDNVASSGAIGTFGRASGYIAARASGRDEQEALEWSEYGAAIGGLGDAFLAVKAGATVRVGTKNLNEGGGLVVSRDAPMTPPPQNVAAPPKNEPSPPPGNTSPSTSTAVTDPWAGSVQRPLDLSKNPQNEPIVLAPPEVVGKQEPMSKADAPAVKGAPTAPVKPPPVEVKPPPALTPDPVQKALPPPDTRQLTLEVEQAQQSFDRLREKASQAEMAYAKSLRNTARAMERRGQQLTQQQADLLATKIKLEQARDNALSKLNEAKKKLRVLQPSEGASKHGQAGLAQEPKYVDEQRDRGLQQTPKNTPVIDAAIVGTPEVHSVKSIVPSQGSDVAVRLAENRSPRDLADRVSKHITTALIDRRSDKWNRLRNRWNNTMRASYHDKFGYELPKNPNDISFVVEVRVVTAKAPSATAQQEVEAAVAAWLKKNERVPPGFTWRINYVSNQ